MKKSTSFLLLILVLLFFTNVEAQSPQILVNQVPFANDKNDDIYQIIQDTTGLLWMVSDDKWYTSDGEKITELPFPFIATEDRYISRSYSISPEGNFFLGGDSVRVYNPYSRTIIQSIGIEKGFDMEGEKPLLHHIVYNDDNDIIWAVYSPRKNIDSGLNIKFTYMQSRNGSPFRDIGIPKKKRGFLGKKIIARADQLFIPATDTIFQYDINGHLVKAHILPSAAFEPIAIESRSGINEPAQFLHRSVNRGAQKMDKALYVLEENSDKFESIPLPGLANSEAILVDKVGDYYWSLGARMAFNRFSTSEEKVIDYSKFVFQQHPDLPYFNDIPLKIFEDNTQTLWVSSQDNGILNLSSSRTPFVRYLGEKNAYPFCASNTCVIRGITADEEGNIYFAYDFGIQKLNSKTGELNAIDLNQSLPLKSAYSLTYNNHKLYFNQLEIDIDSKKTTNIIDGINDHHVTHYLDEENEKMWIADAGLIGALGEPIKLYNYDLKTNFLELLRVFKMPENSLTRVSQFHYSPTTQTVFMATVSDGLYELNMDGTTVQNLVDQEFFGPIAQSLALYEDDNQQLWIGHGQGISKMDLNTRKFTKIPYQTLGAFENIQVYSIQPENKTFAWLGTHKGLYRLNVETGEIRDFQMIPSLANIEFNRLSSYQSADGNLYFGSVEGLFVFQPDSIIAFAHLEEKFPVRISKFSKYNKVQDTVIQFFNNLSTTSVFDLYSHNKYFSFDYFIPDFRDTENNTYKTWLEGYESSWSDPTKSNTIRYDNLPPGDYILHIQGGITPDYYQSSEVQLKINVHQIWYKALWAYYLYAGALFYFIFWLNRYIVNQQLTKAESERFKELDSLKSRLYTNITHEFRTPLTVIMGMTNNIQGYSHEKELIQRNSQNLLQLINQLLDLSKLDSGSLRVSFVAADIVNYIQYLTESFYSLAREKNIQLTFYPEIKELVMDYDVEKIQHIVYNLLTNAIKFTPKEGKVILHLKKVDNNAGSFLQMKVSDTGIGISKENLPNIFDRFYQVESSNYRKESGTGIGLALTKELVEMVGGKIVVISNLNFGTEFEILLPITLTSTPLNKEGDRKDTTQSSIIKNVAIISNSPVPLDRSNKDIELPSLLIIEDNRDVVYYIESILINDYQIEIARNGQLGIDKALEIIPDIIISDVMMPEKDGYEVCAILKSDERSSHIPIILLTAKADPKARIEGLKGGADAYLTKPFDKEELFIRLNKLVELRQLLQEKYSSSTFLKNNKTLMKDPSLNELFLQKLIKVVEGRLDDQDLAVVHLCRAANLSNMQVNRKLKALTGKTPSRFIRSIRLQKAKELLQTTSLNVSEVGYKVGFNDPHFFSRSFSEEFGHPPSVNRKL